jgi:hypothetical protein
MTLLRSRFVALALLLMPLLFGLAAPAYSQTAGLRVGLSADPSQFYFGGHVETAPVVEDVRFRPNIEVGVGDGLTLTAVNFDLVYHFPRQNGWNLYAGGGPALNVYRVRGNSDGQPGFNVVLGAQHAGGFFVEIKGGALDSPNFKLGFGYVFYR